MAATGMTVQRVHKAMTTIANGLPTAIPTTARVLLEILRSADTTAACRADPALIPAAVTAALRTAAHFTFALPGVTTANVQIGGVALGRGIPVLPVIHAAQADRARRQGDNALSLAPPRGPGLAWGAGVHACLGRHLAAVLLPEAVRAVMTGPVKWEMAPGPLNWQRGTLPVPAALPAQAGLPARDHQRRRISA